MMVSNTGGRAGTAGRVEFIFWLAPCVSGYKKTPQAQGGNAMVERRRDKRNPAAKAVRTPQFRLRIVQSSLTPNMPAADAQDR